MTQPPTPPGPQKPGPALGKDDAAAAASGPPPTRGAPPATDRSARPERPAPEKQVVVKKAGSGFVSGLAFLLVLVALVALVTQPVWEPRVNALLLPLIPADLLPPPVAAAPPPEDPRVGQALARLDTVEQSVRDVQQRLSELGSAETPGVDPALAETVARLEADLAALRDGLADRPAGGPGAPAEAPGAADPELGARLTALEAQVEAVAPALARVDTLAEQVESLAARPAGRGSPAAPSADSATVAAVQQELERLQGEVTGFREAVTEQVTSVGQALEGDRVRIASLSGRVDEFATRLAEIDGRVAGVATRLNAVATEAETAATLAAGEAARAAVQTAVAGLPAPGSGGTNEPPGLAPSLAVALLRTELARGAPAAAEFAALRTLSGVRPDLATPLQELERLARAGLPSEDALRTSFDDIAGLIANAKLGPNDGTVVDSVVQGLAGLIVVRPAPDPERLGSEPGDVVARVQGKLAQPGRLSEAVADLRALTLPDGAAREAAAAWLTKAEARLTAEARLEALRRAAAGEEAAPGSTPAPAPPAPTPIPATPAPTAPPTEATPPAEELPVAVPSDAAPVTDGPGAAPDPGTPTEPDGAPDPEPAPPPEDGAAAPAETEAGR